MTLRWSDRAVDDLEHIAARAPRTAARVYQRIAWLAETPFPRAFRPLAPGGDVHVLTVPPYLVVYRVIGDDILVRGIFDARRYGGTR